MPLLTEDLSALMEFPVENELAFCIPLVLQGNPSAEWIDDYGWVVQRSETQLRSFTYGVFDDEHEGIETSLYRFEGYCKAALFLVRQMLHYWDVREEGIPVYIGVSENGLDIFREYASHCNFPESRIVVLPSYEEQWHGWHSKLDMWNADALAQFKRRVHFDASLWLTGHNHLEPCQRLLSLWHSPERQPFAFLKRTLLGCPQDRWLP